MNKKETQIKVLYIASGESPKVMYIPNTLEAKQKLVGGLIEQIAPFDDDVVIICNEESKLYHEENKTFDFLPNRGLYGENGCLYDIIQGPFFLCYAPWDSEDYLSLSEEMIQKYTERFYHPEMLVKTNEGYEMIPCDKDTYLKYMAIVKNRFDEGR